MRNRAAFTILLVAGLATGCNQSPASAPAKAEAPAAPVSSTAEVLARHQQTFGANDVEGVLADYASDATMFTPGGTVKGTEALRKTFQALFAEWGKPGLKFEMKQQIVDGSHAYMFWNAETAENMYEGATDAFVITNGKIVAHFFAGKITPKKK